MSNVDKLNSIIVILREAELLVQRTSSGTVAHNQKQLLLMIRTALNKLSSLGTEEDWDDVKDLESEDF